MPNSQIDKQCFSKVLEESCKELLHFEGVLQGALCKEGKDIGICGKGALDKINAEGKGGFGGTSWS